MKIDFSLPTDGKMHRYCFSCFKEGATQVKNGNRTRYYCNACGKLNDRALYFNTHKFWLDSNRELWHESAGVFVRRKDGKFLFFKRTEFPYKLTVPAGHVDKGEQPIAAAIRELEEEVGIKGLPKSIGHADINGDSCSSGADSHSWYVFLLRLEESIENSGRKVEILDEGEKPLWLTLEEAQKQGMAYVVERISELFSPQLEAVN